MVIAALALAGAFFTLSPQASAQAASSSQSVSGSKSPQGVSDQDIALFRQDIRSQKKQLIAANLALTDTEATKFWPLYDQYTAELTKIPADQGVRLELGFHHRRPSRKPDQAFFGGRRGRRPAAAEIRSDF